MESFISAAIVGLSVSNFWLCGLYAFSMGSADPKAALKFILGRILGLLFIGIWLGLIGRNLHITAWQMDIVFGAISIPFGLYMIFKKGVGRIEAMASQGAGFTVGLIRGATPCMKVLVITPLLAEGGFLRGLAIMTTYSLASSLYPILGFGFATFLGRFYAQRRLIKISGGLVIIILGLYYIFKRLIFH